MAAVMTWDGAKWITRTGMAGVTDGSDPAPGTVGEWLEGWGQGVGTTQPYDPLVYDQLVGSLVLTPGDWLVGGAFQMETVAAPVSCVSSLMGDANNLGWGMSWVVIRGVTGQDLSMTFNPYRWANTTPVTMGMFLQVVTWGSPNITFPYNWDIWAVRLR